MPRLSRPLLMTYHLILGFQGLCLRSQQDGAGEGLISLLLPGDIRFLPEMQELDLPKSFPPAF